jgi:hypothetical protein
VLLRAVNQALFSPTAGGRRHMPEEVYIALETLLPTGKGQFLELWAAPDSPREGWTQVVDVPHS